MITSVKKDVCVCAYVCAEAGVGSAYTNGVRLSFREMRGKGPSHLGLTCLSACDF